MAGSRIEQLQASLDSAGLAAVAVIPGPNLFYLTGVPFHLSERPIVALLCASGKRGLVVPALEASKAEAAGFAVFSYDDVQGPTAAFAKAAAALALSGEVGVEGRRMRFLEMKLLEEAAEVQLAGADELFAKLRMCKDATELAAMRKAVGIAEAALQATLPSIQTGVTEKSVLNELVLQLLKAGSEPELPFHPIVATGPNGALPHAAAGERTIQPGELLTIDWGASADSYFSDITRTYAIGGADVPSRLAEAYEVVRAANAAGREAVRPGTTAEEVDRAARRVVEEAGLGEYFMHRTGHGLGLEVHEEPDIKEGSRVSLAAGMTFTVEPGIYLPGLGGVRIEDDMVVTAKGGESLTGLPRELTVL